MKILLKNFHFKCIIGLLDVERKKAQRVIINLKIYLHEDKMSIDYAKVAKFVKKCYKSNRYFSLEDSLCDIAKQLKSKYPHIKKIKMKIFKPDILRKCEAGVEIVKKY